MPKPQTKSAGAKPKARAKPRTKAPPGTARPPAGQVVDEHQLSSLMSKSLDLAEAGLTLGMNFVQRFGSTVQDQFITRLSQAGQAFQQPAPAPASASTTAGPEPAVAAEPSPAKPTEGNFAGVANPQPLFPGSPIRVSFSVNNDSASAEKKIALKLEGLKGEITGARLDAAALAVEPASVRIAPMDFEKFVLRGLVPVDTRSDAYRGWIVVSGDEQLRIPLRLLVTGRK